MRIVCHFSCGAASAVATKLALGLYGAGEIVIYNAFIEEEHEDNRRFLADCEKWFGHPITVLRYFPRIFAGTHATLPFVAMHRVRRVAITTSRPIWIYADGEPICRTPAEIEVVPQALTVLCPATG